MRITIIQNPLEKTNIAHVDAVNIVSWKKSIDTVAEAIQSCGHTVEKCIAGRGLEADIQKKNPDMVFLQSFRTDPEGTIFNAQELLERLGIPFTGSPLHACKLARDKYRAKIAFRNDGLPTPDFALIPLDDTNIHKPDHLEYPLFIKPISIGASQGIHAENPIYTDEVFERVVRETLGAVGQPLLVETFITGREFTVGILGNDPPVVLPIREFVDMQSDESGKKFRSFSGKTDKVVREKTVCPADLADDERKQIARLAVRAFQALGCADYGRVDFRLDEAGNPFLLEINVHPNLLPGSSYPKMAMLHGMDYLETIGAIIEAAVVRIH
jgi:D-alanine-D-alanine ligase